MKELEIIISKIDEAVKKGGYSLQDSINIANAIGVIQQILNKIESEGKAEMTIQE